MRISGEAPRRRAHSLPRHEAMGNGGSPPPRIVLALHRAEADERRNTDLGSPLFHLALFATDPLSSPAAAWHQPALRPWSRNATARSATCVPKPRSSSCARRGEQLQFVRGTILPRHSPFGT